MSKLTAELTCRRRVVDHQGVNCRRIALRKLKIMSLFSWLSGPSGTTKPASDEAGAATMRPPPCVQVRTSPVVQMKRKPPSRAAEELYVAIRESMTRSGAVVEFQVQGLVVDQQGNTFLMT
jgi:hypothetical protein